MITRWLWWFQTLGPQSWQKEWERVSALNQLLTRSEEEKRKKKKPFSKKIQSTIIGLK